MAAKVQLNDLVAIKKSRFPLSIHLISIRFSGAHHHKLYYMPYLCRQKAMSNKCFVKNDIHEYILNFSSADDDNKLRRSKIYYTSTFLSFSPSSGSREWKSKDMAWFICPMTHVFFKRFGPKMSYLVYFTHKKSQSSTLCIKVISQSIVFSVFFSVNTID